MASHPGPPKGPGEDQSGSLAGRNWEEEGPYDNAGLNDLNPLTSVEDNQLQGMNINPNVPLIKEKPMPRRKSLYKYQKKLEDINRKIHERLDAEDKPSNKDKDNFSENTPNMERRTSDTEPKRVYSAGSDYASKEDIYSTRIQEGNNNLMFFCEPKSRKKCCYKQVGDNNVMINLHMSMIANSCQMLDADTGKVFQLDSDGEVWLEIKVRHNKSSDRLSSCSTVFNDSNTSRDSNSDKPSPSSTTPSSFPAGIPTSHRVPTEHADTHPPTPPVRGEISKHLNNLSGSGGSGPDGTDNAAEDYRRLGRIIEESHRSGEEGEDNADLNDAVADNVTVYKMEDSIFVQVETPERLSEYANLEECQSVKEALRRRAVKDFLESQANNLDFDVSIIGWEYEREPLYSLPEVNVVNASIEEPMYSEVPPPRHRQEAAYSVDISPVLKEVACGHPWDPLKQTNTPNGGANDRNIAAEGACKLNIPVDETEKRSSQIGDASPPALPPKPNTREPCEHTEKPHLQTTMSYEDMTVDEFGKLRVKDADKLGLERRKVVKVPKSPCRELPKPPVFERSKSPLSEGKSEASTLYNRTGNTRSDTSEPPLTAPWYHGKLGNDASKELLSGMRTGSFLLRDSSDTSGDHKYTLEFVDNNAVRRLKIIKSGNRYHLKETENMFDTVTELVEEALKNGIEVRGDRSSRDWRMIRITPVVRKS